MIALGPRDRRALGVGAAVLVPALLYVGAVQPFLASMSDTRAALAAERQALARERALLAAGTRGVRARHSVDSLVAVQSRRLFEAGDDAIAGAQLSTYLAGMARANRVWIQEAQAQPASVSPSGVRTFSVAIRAESDFEGVMDFLQAIEGGAKLLRIDALTLAAPNDADRASSPGVVRLRATLVGFGLMPPPGMPRPASVATR